MRKEYRLTQPCYGQFASIEELSLGGMAAGRGRGAGLTRDTVDVMRSAIVLALGVLVALAGLLFTLQGFGALSGSPMSDTTTWSILGPVIALIGIAVAFAGWRARK